ncbi:MAG: cytochrome C [Flavobacteriia bacterium]|nr:cytochrome C [Flavobacteriia bacterium]
MRRLLSILLLLCGVCAYAQFSPGELSEAHSHLEGMSNCSSCHEAGNRVPDVKCLDCHNEIESLINLDRGYHSSSEVQTKTCVDCHSEHHGRSFNSVRVDEDGFNHSLTGYELDGAHNRIECRDCHQPTNIANRDIRKRTDTYLGLGSTCLSCHTDYHQGTLGSSCTDCHNIEDWRPAPGFDHDETDYALTGAHREVECVDCHEIGTRYGEEYQAFSGIDFGECLDCHRDEHEGRFGRNCTECHSIFSWTQMKSNNTFNHDLTDYPLEGKHNEVECIECHTSGRNSQPLAFGRCDDCHDDYHEGEFTTTRGKRDCAECHNVMQNFTWSSYSISEHNETDWPLEGAHMATPCFACHKPDEEPRWSFALESTSCVSCHDDVHEGYISEQYYPEKTCESCHSSNTWSSVEFDHTRTDWALEGAHESIDCRECHWRGEDDVQVQEFSGLNTDCATCHDNPHGRQFEVSGTTDCLRCHSLSTVWNIATFDHSSTEFPLDGKHAQLECAECHQPKIDDDGVERVEYVIDAFQCIDCHGSN